jgi:RNA polymerase sigma factor (sigma-70 family)
MPMIRHSKAFVFPIMDQSTVVIEGIGLSSRSHNRLRQPRSHVIRTGSKKKFMTDAHHADSQQLVEWMQRLAGCQDRDAFAGLFAYFAPRIKAYMMRSGSDNAAAEEFAQEAMLMVWRKANSFDASQASVATWVFTIARNKRIDAFRRINRPELDPDDPLLQPAAEPMQDDKVVEDQTARTIAAAMDQLPEEQAVMLRMAFYEDKAHSEIADETGLPLGTVKSRLRLAMGKLRSLLGDTEL